MTESCVCLFKEGHIHNYYQRCNCVLHTCTIKEQTEAVKCKTGGNGPPSKSLISVKS